MPKNWNEAKVIEITPIGSKTKRFLLQLAGGVSLAFKPGQFITLDLPIGQKRLDRWRSYSVASFDQQRGLIELCIVKLDGGKASTYLCEELTVGDVLTFKGPDGQFVLPKTLPKKLILVCTGTGVAPFKSMVTELYTKTDLPDHVHLIFGTRYEKDILYRDYFQSLADRYDSFKYTVVLSREPDWKGYKGYVHQVYEQEYAEVDNDTTFYLCGWSQMVDQAQKQLTEDLGYNSSQVQIELFG